MPQLKVSVSLAKVDMPAGTPEVELIRAQLVKDGNVVGQSQGAVANPYVADFGDQPEDTYELRVFALTADGNQVGAAYTKSIVHDVVSRLAPVSAQVV